MQNVNIYNNNLFLAENFQYKHINAISSNTIRNNIVPCIVNAQNLLYNLEVSLQQGWEEEEKLLQCKRSHCFLNHGHRRDSETEATKTAYSATSIDNSISQRNFLDIVESWSTMSVVCLQYQYDVLSKRYERLLRAHARGCDALSARDAACARLRRRMRGTHADLTHLHGSLVAVGEKYLSLKYKKMLQSKRHKMKTERLKQAVAEILAAVERSHLEVKEQVAQCMSMEHDTAVTLLLEEIRKSNLLILQNLQLKTKIEELTFTS